MRKYKDVIRKYNLKPISYIKKGNALIIDTKEKKYVIKEKIRNPDIYEYLDSRSFNYYPPVISDDNYYLIAFDGKNQELRHFRIDKMRTIKLTFEPREGKDVFKSFDIVDYSRKTFGMFSGKEETVTVEAPHRLAGVFIDRFGEAANIRKNFDNPDKFLVRIAVNVSPQFYAWIFGLGKDVKIISPESVKEDFIKTTTDILSNYES